MFSADGEDYFDIIGLRQLGRARGLRCALRIVWWLVIACLGFRTAHAQCPAIVDLLLPQFIAHDFAVKSFGPIRCLNRSQSHTILANTTCYIVDGRTCRYPSSAQNLIHMDLETASDSAIPRQSLTSAVADKLRDQIIRSELPEGAQPRQDAIATQHQVSRIPVRDALRQLDAEGLIAIVPNRGAVVPALSPDDIEELFLIRALLEPEVLKLSIPHLLQEDFSEAEAVLRKYVSELCSTPCPGNLDLLSVKHRKLGRIGSLSSRAARRRSFATSHASIRRTLVPGI